jgi:hypothetical protein
MEKECGVCDAKTVVDRSRPKTSALHECFEWKDGVAAEEWRKQQARVLIGQIVRVNIESQEPEVRAFVCVSYKTEEEKQQNKYVSIDTALNDEEYRSQLFEKALEEIKYFQSKYRNLKEFEKVFHDIDELIQMKFA